MDFAAILVGTVDATSRSWIAERMGRYRAAVLQRQLLDLAEPSFLDSCEDYAPLVERYLTQLCAWWVDDPERFRHHTDHWAAPFCLSRLTSPASSAPERRVAAA